MQCYLTVCSCHVMYVFQSESSLYSCLNVKERLTRSRHEIWSLRDCKWNRTQIDLVHKRTPVWLNGWVFVYELSGSGFDSSCSHSAIFPRNRLTLKIQTYSEIILKQSFFKKAHVEFQLSLLGQMKLMLKEYVIQIGVSSK